MSRIPRCCCCWPPWRPSRCPWARTARRTPSRPIRMIVPDAPGGSPDQLGRLVAQKLSDALGQQVFVDNKPGAAGVLATDAGAKSAPDGYTVTMTTTAIYAILPYLNKSLPYDPVKDFIPISRLATASNVLVVNASLPVKSVADLVQLAKAKPGVLNYASAGVGSPAHLAGEMLNLLAGIKLVHVPYKGVGTGAARRDRGQRAADDHVAARGRRAHDERPRAGHCHDGCRAQSRAARPADDRRDDPRLRDLAVVGPRGAGGHAARDRREAERGDREGDARSRTPCAACEAHGLVPAGDSPEAFASLHGEGARAARRGDREVRES